MCWRYTPWKPRPKIWSNVRKNTYPPYETSAEPVTPRGRVARWRTEGTSQIWLVGEKLITSRGPTGMKRLSQKISVAVLANALNRYKKKLTVVQEDFKTKVKKGDSKTDVR